MDDEAHDFGERTTAKKRIILEYTKRDRSKLFYERGEILGG